MHYGPLYRERILESVRKQVEHCDALQSFFLCHSMVGGWVFVFVQRVLMLIRKTLFHYCYFCITLY